MPNHCLLLPCYPAALPVPVLDLGQVRGTVGHVANKAQPLSELYWDQKLL